jgi:hypothetical protein
LKPVTDSLKLAEQLKLVDVVGEAAGAQENEVTVGEVRSITHV